MIAARHVMALRLSDTTSMSRWLHLTRSEQWGVYYMSAQLILIAEIVGIASGIMGIGMVACRWCPATMVVAAIRSFGMP
jgi:hypothetical protein